MLTVQSTFACKLLFYLFLVCNIYHYHCLTLSSQSSKPSKSSFNSVAYRNRLPPTTEEPTASNLTLNNAKTSAYVDVASLYTSDWVREKYLRMLLN